MVAQDGAVEQLQGECHDDRDREDLCHHHDLLALGRQRDRKYRHRDRHTKHREGNQQHQPAPDQDAALVGVAGEVKRRGLVAAHREDPGRHLRESQNGRHLPAAGDTQQAYDDDPGHEVDDQGRRGEDVADRHVSHEAAC